MQFSLLAFVASQHSLIYHEARVKPTTVSCTATPSLASRLDSPDIINLAHTLDSQLSSHQILSRDFLPNITENSPSTNMRPQKNLLSMITGAGGDDNLASLDDGNGNTIIFTADGVVMSRSTAPKQPSKSAQSTKKTSKHVQFSASSSPTKRALDQSSEDQKPAVATYAEIVSGYPNKSTNMTSDDITEAIISIAKSQPTILASKLYSRLARATLYLGRPDPSLKHFKIGMNTLFNLLDTSSLAAHPIIHAMVHTLIAINTPPNAENWCWYKTEHTRKAEAIVEDLKTKRHPENCQGCLYVKLQEQAGKCDLDDGDECNSLARLERMLQREREFVQHFNWGDLDEWMTGKK